MFIFVVLIRSYHRNGRLLSQYCYRSGDRLGTTDFVRLTATEPARIHGLNNKGDIAVGMDADIVVWDPTQSHIYGADDLNER